MSEWTPNMDEPSVLILVLSITIPALDSLCFEVYICW